MHVSTISHRSAAGLLPWLLGLWLLAQLPGALAQPASQPWFEQGRPSALAHEAVALLARADEDGLRPEDYNAPALQQAVQAATQTPLSDEAQTQLAQELSTAMRALLHALHHGRVDPQALGEDFSSLTRDGFDAGAALAQAVAAGQLAPAVRAAVPQLPIYAGLRRALADYRRLAADPQVQTAWRDALPSLPGRKLEPGQSWTGVPTLQVRLRALGDLHGELVAGTHYQSGVVEALRRFQRRHGLADDGVIGQGTLAALNIAPTERIRQIELAMERLRWTPWAVAPRQIVVNVPEFMLRAIELQDGRAQEALVMKVIVGRARAHQTPLFTEEMRFIEFSPYWNVPPSIARGETIPRLRRDPEYFAQQGFEFVAPDGRVSNSLSAEQLDAVARGQLRIRQRPGAHNALGDIKFVFPNQDNIYLHHTPSVGLFARDRRDFSHGCIRVERPTALAGFVLKHQPEWPESRIEEAMKRGRSATLRLDEPLPVVIAYITALVKEDGLVYFFGDIYGHDRALNIALQRDRAPLRSVAAR